MFGKSILILVPHPDDEVVACAAALGRAQAEGANIMALYLTHGCIARDTLWPWQRKHYETGVTKRRAEAENAARFLGITSVGWSRRPARHLWRELMAVFDEIGVAIAANNIDQLWVPAFEGGNPDHDALNAVGSLFKNRISVLEFAEYNFAGGDAHSQEFPIANGSEQILNLAPNEQKKKRDALALYASEKRNLNYVKTTRECFRPLASYSYSLPPHPGTLWYQRYQWVPFRHPRVDFTAPVEVLIAITTFLNAKASDLPEPATAQDQERREAGRGSGG